MGWAPLGEGFCECVSLHVQLSVVPGRMYLGCTMVPADEFVHLCGEECVTAESGSPWV